MPTRTNKNSLPASTDKILLEFLVSPFRKSGFRNYKSARGISIPVEEEEEQRLSNRLSYLKRLHDRKFSDFAELCQKHGVNQTHLQSPPPQSTPTKPTSQSPPRSTPTKPTLIPTPPSTEKMNLIAASNLNHQVCLNDEFPSLNDNGMIFFRDDDVEIGESMNSILTIYQPLFDARDYDLVSLKIDPEDPSRLIHTYPGLPTFMFRDYDKVHKLERSEENPEIYSATKKKHKKLAFKIKGNKQLKLKTTEFELPFELATNKFDEINNTLAEVQKNYRSLSLPVTDKIKQTCSFVFWKIMIQGETQDCFSDVEEEEVDVFYIAQNRARDPPGTRPLKDNDRMEESDEEIAEESGGEIAEESDEESDGGYKGEGPHFFEYPEEIPSNGKVADQDGSVSTEETTFVGDVVETESTEIDEVATTALGEHLKRFGRFLSESNKKAKLHDRKPMDDASL